LHIKYQKELRSQLRSRFDRFAVLETWNFGEPKKCKFSVEAHKAEGEHILNTVQERIRQELFIPEEFEDLAVAAAKDSRSVGQLLDQLQEPRPNGEPSIPWLGETEIKEQVIRLCAHGRIAINLGREWLQSKPGEPFEDAWNRMKGRLPAGRQLDTVILSEPGSAVTSGGGQPGIGTGATTPKGTDTESGTTTTTTTTTTGGGSGGSTGTGLPGDLFGGGSGSGTRTPVSSNPTSALNLLGKLETWGINAGTPLHNVKLSVDQLSGAQLEKLLKHLPDGVTYGIELEKE